MTQLYPDQKFSISLGIKVRLQYSYRGRGHIGVCIREGGGGILSAHLFIGTFGKTQRKQIKGRHNILEILSAQDKFSKIKNILRIFQANFRQNEVITNVFFYEFCLQNNFTIILQTHWN